MDPIKNNGAMDYTMTMPQQNNVQPTQEEDYSSMPMVYDPEVEEKKIASSNMLGMTALGLLAVGGMGYGFYKGRQVSGLNKEISKLGAEKETLGKAKEEAVKALDKERTLSFKERLFRLFKPEYGMTKEEKEARKAALDAKVKVAEESKKNKVKSEAKTEDIADKGAEETK